MPVRLTPSADAVISTKRVSMPEWDTEGPYAEWIEILVFLRTETLEAAQKAGRRTVVERGQTKEEIANEPYYRSLFDAQVKGWRLLDQDLKEIPFSPEHLAALPWDVKFWLNGQIIRCGGALATRDLVVETASGTPLDFKSTDAGVGTTDRA